LEDKRMALANVLKKNKKNTTATYEQWAVDAENNARIENSDQTPSAPSNIWRKWNEQTAPGATAPGATVPPTTAPSVGGVFGKYVTNLTPGIGATTGALQGALRSTPNVVSPGNVDATGAPAGAPTTPYTESEDFAKWVSENGYTSENGKINTNLTPTTPQITAPSNTPSAEAPVTTPTVTPTTTDNGFAKWLETDPAMQARMRAAETDYYKNLATYGAQGEALAKSGLIGSGWSEYLKGNAYSAMQAEKAGVRSEGYAKWFGDQEAAKAEETATAEGLNAAAQTVFSYLVEQGKESITDADLSYLYGLGFSKDAIDKAVTAYNDYSTKSKVEDKDKIETELNKITDGGTASDFLASFGISTEGMDENQIKGAIVGAVAQAVKDGTLSTEKASAFIKSEIIVDEDTSNTTIKKRAKNAADSIAIDDSVKAMLTDEDYSEIVKAAYDSLGIQKIYVDTNTLEVDNEGYVFDIVIDIKNTKGETERFRADWGGHYRVSDGDLLGSLNSEYSGATLAYYNDKCYFQYAPKKWTEIKMKGESYGNKKLGSQILAVVSTYVGNNGIQLDRK
jgi:hypothetical protein